MTPVQFEMAHRSDWDELELRIDQLRQRHVTRTHPEAADRLAVLYRGTCEQLALARARAYPAAILQRLEILTADAHELIYRRREFGWRAIVRIVTTDFPRAVRDSGSYVALAALLLMGPMLAVGMWVYLEPTRVTSLISAADTAAYRGMYSEHAESIGRTASTDVGMFGHYVANNIGIAFQCFAGGIFAGVGSLVFLAFNGAHIGGVAGFLTAEGLGATFYSFVATHGAFELTGIVLSGAAGLRLGHAFVAPGRRRRKDALVLAARPAITIVYGVIVLLLIAAAVEAFWSSSQWLPHAVKYIVAALCWAAVIAYLALQGRDAR